MKSSRGKSAHQWARRGRWDDTNCRDVSALVGLHTVHLVDTTASEPLLASLSGCTVEFASPVNTFDARI